MIVRVALRSMLSLPSGRLRHLLLSGLQKCTQDMYAAEVDTFLSELHVIAASWDTADHDTRDLLLAEYLAEKAEDETAKVQHFAILLAALHKLDPRKRFVLASRTDEAWRLKTPVKQAPAMPEVVALACASLAFGCDQSDVDALILLCYFVLLRVGEALGLRAVDLALVKNVLAIHLPKTKRGIQERAVVDNVLVVRALAEWHAAEGARRLATSLKYHQFASALRRLCANLGMTQSFTSHSHRRGGGEQPGRQGQPH